MIIRSILENDLYKFSMSYYYQVHYPNAWGTFSFHDRNNTEYSEDFVGLLKEEFQYLATISLQPTEFDWAVKTIPYIPQCFWEWLCYFRFEPDKILIILLVLLIHILIVLSALILVLILFILHFILRSPPNEILQPQSAEHRLLLQKTDFILLLQCFIKHAIIMHKKASAIRGGLKQVYFLLLTSGSS